MAPRSTPSRAAAEDQDDYAAARPAADAAGGSNSLSMAALVALVGVAVIFATTNGSGKAAGSALHAPAPTFAAVPMVVPVPPSTADVT
jgi:hypothetical protein